jgi:hypothetical protein
LETRFQESLQEAKSDASQEVATFKADLIFQNTFLNYKDTIYSKIFAEQLTNKEVQTFLDHSLIYITKTPLGRQLYTTLTGTTPNKQDARTIIQTLSTALSDLGFYKSIT